METFNSASAPEDVTHLVKRPADWNDRINRRPLPSQDELREMFSYSPETGLLYWKEREGNNNFNVQYAGKPVGRTTKRGYRQVTINKVNYWCHRLIWKHVFGIDPREIDHINGIKSDNRIKNLRDVDRSTNNKNIRREPESGVVGVHFAEGAKRWAAQISIHKRAKHLGYFVTKAEAIAARKAAEIALDYFEYRSGICQSCEVQHGYRDRLVDDVQPDQRPPLPLRLLENPHAE